MLKASTKIFDNLNTPACKMLLQKVKSAIRPGITVIGIDGPTAAGKTILAETYAPHTSTYLFTIKQVKEAAKNLGFNVILYSGFVNKALRNPIKSAPVCVLIKR